MEEAIFQKYWYEYKGKCSRDMVVTITLPVIPDNKKLYYIAAAPADVRTTFTGSGLPFISVDQAFCGTPNSGVVDAPAKRVVLELSHPNKVYEMSVMCIPPSVFLMYTSNGEKQYHQVKLSDYAYPSRDVLYTKQEPRDFTLVKTQEEYLLETAYPELCSQ